MSENDFTKRFASLGNAELLDILENAKDYQPLAVETARLELDNRKLSAEQLLEAKTEHDRMRLEKSRKSQKIRDLENRVKSVGMSVVDTINPIQGNKVNTDKYIKLVSLFLGGLFLYHLFEDFTLLKFIMTDEDEKWSSGDLIYFLPFVILPAAGILFWFRKRLGWMLTGFYLSLTASGAIAMFVIDIRQKITGMLDFNNLFPFTRPAVHVGTILLFSGVLWMICKLEIREIYKINKVSMFIIPGIGALILLLYFLGF